ncbi:signal transduction histidine kinase [Sulfitobacter undariae]|uniref:histidine kinase n=1 Tax=Sulfitobacter undariae TaxID=1563671 RepID=A0A7W6EBP4_9RHOB|nr:signal transduction histidine kinase [Sulfitobacter undariae]
MREAGFKTRDKILEFADQFDSLTENREQLVAEIPALLVEARALREMTVQLVGLTGRAKNDWLVDTRVFMSARHQQIAISVFMLTLTLCGLVGLLLAQARQDAQSQRNLQQLSEENSQAADTAQAANRAKSRFLATMSHEIRTPLNGIIGMSEVLSHSDLSGDQVRSVDIIRESGNLLLDVINDILEISHLETGENELREERFHLQDVTEPIRKLMDTSASERNITLEIDAPNISLCGDPARLRQVLVNLVGNAMKFTDKGDVFLRIWVDHGTGVYFEVEDTGIGISEESIAKLFGEFVQVDTSNTRRTGGTGLGLAICKRLVEAMKGTIGARSKLGVGSCFWFVLPDCDPRDEVFAKIATPEKPTRKLDPGLRILVVDDSKANRSVVTALLKKLGVTATCAQNGEEAVERIMSMDFDLVFMDMRMPLMDGLAATRQVREAGSRTYIIGLTANAFETDRKACLDAGMNWFVSKPVTLNKLSTCFEVREAAA